MFYRSDQTHRSYRPRRYQETFRGSRLPTHAEYGKPDSLMHALDLEQSKAAPLQALGKLTPRGSFVLSAETAVTYFRAFFAASITLCSTSAGSSW
jgi:hypothetical protein